jgi:hypothetical protein
VGLGGCGNEEEACEEVHGDGRLVDDTIGTPSTSVNLNVPSALLYLRFNTIAPKFPDPAIRIECAQYTPRHLIGRETVLLLSALLKETARLTRHLRHL